MFTTSWSRDLSAQTEVKTYVVDVCGTLVNEDTTFGLLTFHFDQFKGRPFRPYIFRFLTAQSSPVRWAFVVIEKLTGRHWLKYLVVRLLAGDYASALDESGRAYVKNLLMHCRVAPVWALLSKVSQPDNIILASASLEPVVRALAHAIGAGYVSSTLEVRNGMFTGRYVEDLTGKKESAILLKYGAEVLSNQYTAISDNLSDRALLAKASHAYVILHHESHRVRWLGLPAEFLKVTN